MDMMTMHDYDNEMDLLKQAMLPDDYPPEAKIHMLGDLDKNTLKQFKKVMNIADRGALMADGHMGYILPIGGVAAFKGKISPTMVGYDIGCGNNAIMTSLEPDAIKPVLEQMMDEIYDVIPFGIGKINNKVDKDHAVFEDDAWDIFPPEVKEKMRDEARAQLGTVGAGNHYVDIFEDNDDCVWIGTHCGSRGFGWKTCQGFINLIENGDWMKRAKENVCLVDVKSIIGSNYKVAMELAGRYARVNREVIVDTVLDIIGTDNYKINEISNHHNFAWNERHLDPTGKFFEDYIVIRKGSTPNFPDQLSFVGGSMGDISVILKGKESVQNRECLYSTVHGAGRIMSRREAAGKYKYKKGKKVKMSEGSISWDMLRQWIGKEGIKLKGGAPDEAPQAYKRIEEVLKYHSDSVEIETVLRPLGVLMASEFDEDPYKD